MNRIKVVKVSEKKNERQTQNLIVIPREFALLCGVTKESQAVMELDTLTKRITVTFV